MKNASFFRPWILLLCAVLLLGGMTGCGSQDASALTCIDDLESERIGVQSGTLYETGLVAAHPNLKISYYFSATDLAIALQQGKLDAFITEDITFRILKNHFDWIRPLEGMVETSAVSIAISSKSGHPELKEQANRFIAESWENGLLEELESYWLEHFDPIGAAVDKSGITGENGVISVAMETGYEPFSYISNGELVGYDVDLIYHFCRAYGYRPEFYTIEYDAIATGLGSGKYDLGTNVLYSEERSQEVLLTEPYKYINIILAAGVEESGQVPLFQSLRESFEKTFLREDRWKLFLEGAGTTLMIAGLAAAFGALIGFFLYLLNRRGGRLVNAFNRAASWLISGMPTVLFLMILYYLVFVGSADIGGVWVAVVGFSLLFGFSVYEILNTSVSAIGRGQEEGARALGYSDSQAFFHVILPQSLRVAFPQIKSEVVNLIKETSIVGYISITDLTKMSDLVRARTYEPFFPLITTAAIYFLLIGLMLMFIRQIEFRMTSRERRIRRIKGSVRTR